MISNTEIREHARSDGVPESTIERDYAQNWFLNALNSIDNKMVLKGGTGIRKAYVEGYRFSDDLDFTLLSKIDKRSLNDSILKSIRNAKECCGIYFDDNIRLDENINGYEGTIYFRIIRRTGSPHKIKLDITGNLKEKIIFNPLRRKLIHNYSDELKSKILIYPLNEIIAEKLRAIFEITRPRDIYDIVHVWDKVDKLSIPKIFMEKCEYKDVNPDVKYLINKKDDFKHAWEASLQHQLKIVPDFDLIFNKILKILKLII